MKFIQCFLFLVLTAISASAQTRTITGLILDGDFGNEPLPGATVSIPASGSRPMSGTTSDLEGKFSIQVDEQVKLLEVRFIGYQTQKVTLKPGVNYYEVVLKGASKEIDELVVTGYQKIDRRKLTAAVTTINISDEKIGAVKSIDQALAGQISGLSTVSTSGAPGAPVKIRIRGTASINGTQEPLWVLDGIPLEGTDIPDLEDLKDIDNLSQTSIAGINPSDIESITVLKDAAATAIYGARAANGVIVITTKKGKAGKPQINFSTKLTYNPRISMDRLNLLNSEEKVNLELDLLRSGYTFRENKGDVARILARLEQTDAYKQNGWDGLTAEAQSAINQLKQTQTDWNDILFRDVFNQEYNFSIAGGNDKADYYTSMGYYKEQGNVTGVDNNRFNLTLKTNYQINSRLKIGASVFANQRKQNSYMTDYNGFVNPVYYSRLANPYMRPYDENGDYIYDINVQGGKEDSELDFNIFEERANTSNERTDKSLMAIFDGALKINDHLNLTSQFGLQIDGSTLDKYAGENSFAMRKDHERAQYSFSDGKRSFLPDGGMHKVTETHSKQWTWKTMLEYNQVFNKLHALELMGGTELRHATYNSLFSAAYGYDNRTLTSVPVIFPNENMADLFPLHQESFTENAFVSWFATGSYTFKHRYTLGASIRFDGSDVFGVAKKYRYLPLYSVSGLWRLKEENFLKGCDNLSDWSIRASYGIQGNIDKNTSPYLIGSYDQTTILPGYSEDIIVSETAPNPSLRWEKTQNTNVGTDVAVLKNAIRLSVDYYYRYSSDLIGMKMLPLETGFASSTINWASMENRGVEVALATKNIMTKNFTWFTNINLGFNENTVLQETVAENATYPGREGYPVGAIFAYKTAGLDDEGYPLFVTKDGKKVNAKEFFQLNQFGASTLSAKEQRELYTYAGTTDPKVSGGFINTFEYKNWQLGINFFFNLGMKVRVTPTYSPTNFDRGLNTNHDILNRWTPENTNTIFPTLMTGDTRIEEYKHYSEFQTYNMLDIWVKDCNYARLQSLRLGYKVPENWLKKFGVTGASLSLEGRNLLVIASNYDNYLDPETMGNPYAQPVAKSVIFGLNVNF